MKRQNEKPYWASIFKQLFLPEFGSFGGYANHLQCGMSAPKESRSFDNLFCNIAKSKLPPKYDPVEKNENQQI